VNAERKVTPDGLEYTFATNYLAPFLLTELLLDVLQASASRRIVNVSSVVHISRTIDFADLQKERRYRPMKAYSQSKLAQIYSTYELADRLKGTDVTANALHPGNIRSNFNDGLRGTGLTHFINSALYSLFGITVKQGAQTMLYLATSPEVEGVSGKYFSNCKQTRSSRRPYDVAVRKHLWHVSEELIRPYVQLSVNG